MSFLEPYLDALCNYYDRLWVIFIIAVIFLLLSLVFVYALEPGSAGHAVSVLNLATLSLFAGLSGGLILVCLRR